MAINLSFSTVGGWRRLWRKALNAALAPRIPGSQDPRILAGGLQTGDGGAEAQDRSPAIGQVGPTTSRVGGWIGLKEVPQTDLL